MMQFMGPIKSKTLQHYQHFDRHPPKNKLQIDREAGGDSRKGVLFSVKLVHLVPATFLIVAVVTWGLANGQETTLTAQPRISVFAEIGEEPSDGALGDFNGDGNLDIVTANRSSDNVIVMFGDGFGGFANPEPISVGDFPVSVAVGDVNADGKSDIIAANQRSDDLSILLGDGAGGFSAAANSPLPVGAEPSHIILADLNADGNVDVVTTNSASDDVSVLLNDGTGGFAVAANSPFAVGREPIAVAVDDIDANGNMDLLIANSRSFNVSVLLGDGNGSFTPSAESPISAGNGPRSIAIGDVDGDGNSDFVVADDFLDRVYVLLGDGAGGFSAATDSPYAVGKWPHSVALSDLDDDGDPDLVTANFGSDDVSVLLNDGTGGFVSAASSPFRTGDAPISVTIGDVDVDGNADVVTTNFGTDDVGIFLGDGGGGFPVTNESPGYGADPVAVAVSDLDNDSLADAVILNRSRDGLLVLRGNGNGTFERVGLSEVPGRGKISLGLADVNTDGDEDLLALNVSSDDVSVHLGDGAGGFAPLPGSPFSIGPAGSIPQSFALSDLNSDGALDLVTANGALDNVSVLLGDGTGGFGAATSFAVGDNPRSVAAGDIDEDGHADLVTANGSSDDISVLFGDGGGNFGPANSFAVGSRPQSVALGDVNADGNIDVLTANRSSSNVSILLGNGNGGFAESVGSPVSVGLGPITILLGDMNADGNTDLATANWSSDDVSILLGDGTGTFVTAMESPISVGTVNFVPQSVALSDIDGDSLPDLISINDGEGPGNELMTVFTSDVLFSDVFQVRSVAE